MARPAVTDKLYVAGQTGTCTVVARRPVRRVQEDRAARRGRPPACELVPRQPDPAARRRARAFATPARIGSASHGEQVATKAVSGASRAKVFALCGIRGRSRASGLSRRPSSTRLLDDVVDEGAHPSPGGVTVDDREQVPLGKAPAHELLRGDPLRRRASLESAAPTPARTASRMSFDGKRSTRRGDLKRHAVHGDQVREVATAAKRSCSFRAASRAHVGTTANTASRRLRLRAHDRGHGDLDELLGSPKASSARSAWSGGSSRMATSVPSTATRSGGWSAITTSSSFLQAQHHVGQGREQPARGRPGAERPAGAPPCLGPSARGLARRPQSPRGHAGRARQGLRLRRDAAARPRSKSPRAEPAGSHVARERRLRHPGRRLLAPTAIPRRREVLQERDGSIGRSVPFRGRPVKASHLCEENGTTYGLRRTSEREACSPLATAWCSTTSLRPARLHPPVRASPRPPSRTPVSSTAGMIEDFSRLRSAALVHIEPLRDGRRRRSPGIRPVLGHAIGIGQRRTRGRPLARFEDGHPRRPLGRLSPASPTKTCGRSSQASPCCAEPSALQLPYRRSASRPASADLLVDPILDTLNRRPEDSAKSRRRNRCTRRADHDRASSDDDVLASNASSLVRHSPVPPERLHRSCSEGMFLVSRGLAQGSGEIGVADRGICTLSLISGAALLAPRRLASSPGGDVRPLPDWSSPGRPRSTPRRARTSVAVEPWATGSWIGGVAQAARARVGDEGCRLLAASSVGHPRRLGLAVKFHVLAAVDSHVAEGARRPRSAPRSDHSVQTSI